MKKTLANLLQTDRKSLTLMAVAVTTILSLLIGATSAYFRAQAGGGSGADLNAATGTTDSLSFSVGKDINLHVTLDDFLEGMESPHGETTATATLKANNVTNQAAGRYNVFFIIDNNNFEYSTEDGKTELLLKVTDPNGNEVMDITGLKRVEGGFDITTRTGGFLIMADYDIEATPTETLKAQTWKLEVTFVNLDSDQNINKGKSLNGRFYITTEKESTYELAEINSIEAESSYNSITASLNYTVGSSEIDKYYYAIEEDTSGIAYLGAGISVARLSNNLAIKESDYIESNEATHIFDNLKPDTKYKVYSYAVDKYGLRSNIYETTITTAEYELSQVTSLAHTETLTSITVTATAEGGSNEVSLYYFSKDNGVTWSDGQESNTYTFNDLLDTTEYKIKVKVSDAEGIYSTEYYEAIATVTYNNPSVTTVASTKTYNSISLTTTAAGGTNSVANYYYKVGTGSWSEAQTTNTYNITGLSENTKYTIYVKVEDTNGRFSNEYSLDVTTNTYEIPSVSANISKTSNSITVNATGTNGDGTIVKYMYSKDGGSNWITQDNTSTSDSYTFSSLTPNVEYQIRVKVVDNNNRESSEYSTSVTTDKANFTNNTVGVSGTYDGSAKSITVDVSPTPTTIYYSTSTELTASNYSTYGTTSNPSRTNAGTTYVYWCAVKSGYNTYCSMNTITISKKSPTFTVSSTSSPIDSSSTTSSITYTYSGDGAVSCTPYSPSTATYASCSVNTSNKTITFTRKAAGTQTFTISAAAGTNYSAGTSKTVTVTVASPAFHLSCNDNTFACQISKKVTTDSNLYYHGSSLANGAEDNSYRYAGANPNNWVCFGSTATTCPANNLYRIIGVFNNQIKLIKNTSLGSYYWSGSSSNSSNTWSSSTLNTGTLNGTYLSGLGTTWSNKISSSYWKVGGMDKSNTYTAKQYYNIEIAASSSNTVIEAKIGLMYADEYGFAAYPTAWTTALWNYNDSTIKANNWMFSGNQEWTILRYSSNTNVAIVVDSDGYVSSAHVHVYAIDVRPTFYLNSTVTLSSGSGTQSNPYRIS